MIERKMKENKYDNAIQELENLLERMENNDISIDDMPAELKKAQQLIKTCRQQLLKTDEELKKIEASSNEAKA